MSGKKIIPRKSEKEDNEEDNEEYEEIEVNDDDNDDEEIEYVLDDNNIVNISDLKSFQSDKKVINTAAENNSEKTEKTETIQVKKLYEPSKGKGSFRMRPSTYRRTPKDKVLNT